MSFENLTIGLIGAGNMARALVRGLLKAGHPAGRLQVADPDPAQLEQVVALHASVGIHGDNKDVAGVADVLVLAVKPQLMADVARQIAAGPRRAGQLILSVAAGITLGSLRGWFGTDARLVRDSVISAASLDAPKVLPLDLIEWAARRKRSAWFSVRALRSSASIPDASSRKVSTSSAANSAPTVFSSAA